MPCLTLRRVASRSAGGVPVPASPLALGRGAGLAAPAAAALRSREALRRPLLGAVLRARLVRAAGSLQAAAGLPGHSRSSLGRRHRPRQRHRPRRRAPRPASEPPPRQELCLLGRGILGRSLARQGPPRPGRICRGSAEGHPPRSLRGRVLLGDRTRVLLRLVLASPLRLSSRRRSSLFPQLLSRDRCRAPWRRSAAAPRRAASRLIRGGVLQLAGRVPEAQANAPRWPRSDPLHAARRP